MKNSYFKHDSAFVDEGAQIGTGTKIWHNSHITNTAVIGKNCNIGQNCYIAGKMGEGCRIQNNVNVYLGVELGNNVFCGPSMTFTNDMNPRVKYPKHNNYMTTIVGDEVSFGANVTVVCGITIGKAAMIGAGSVVTKNVPAYALAYGNPALIKGWVCCCGEKLPKEFKNTVCSKCSRRYSKSGERIKMI